MLPESSLSVLSPSPMSMGILPSFSLCIFHSQRRLIMLIPARTPRSSSSSCGNGIPKPAMIASPINLSTIPPCSLIASTMMSKYSFNSVTVPCAPKASVIVVKLRTSEKSTVATVSWPPIMSLPSPMSWSAMLGSMYLDIVDFIRFSSEMSSIMIMVPRCPLA